MRVFVALLCLVLTLASVFLLPRFFHFYLSDWMAQTGTIAMVVIQVVMLVFLCMSIAALCDGAEHMYVPFFIWGLGCILYCAIFSAMAPKLFLLNWAFAGCGAGCLFLAAYFWCEEMLSRRRVRKDIADSDRRHTERYPVGE